MPTLSIWHHIIYERCWKRTVSFHSSDEHWYEQKWNYCTITNDNEFFWLTSLFVVANIVLVGCWHSKRTICVSTFLDIRYRLCVVPFCSVRKYSSLECLWFMNSIIQTINRNRFDCNDNNSNWFQMSKVIWHIGAFKEYAKLRFLPHIRYGSLRIDATCKRSMERKKQ